MNEESQNTTYKDFIHKVKIALREDNLTCVIIELLNYKNILDLLHRLNEILVGNNQ